MGALMSIAEDGTKAAAAVSCEKGKATLTNGSAYHSRSPGSSALRMA
jgi:hypothetical protein